MPYPSLEYDELLDALMHQIILKQFWHGQGTAFHGTGTLIHVFARHRRVARGAGRGDERPRRLTAHRRSKSGLLSQAMMISIGSFRFDTAVADAG
jgi:hypothetical protein